MPRLFVPATAIDGDVVRIEGAPARHLAGSLRVRPGTLIEIVDSAGIAYSVEVTAAGVAMVEGTIAHREPAAGEPRLHIEVLQAIPKSGMDEAIDLMASVGVSVIRPVITERTVVRPDASRAASRTTRWNDIARESAERAYRASIPHVAAVAALDEALAALASNALLLGCAITPGALPLAGASVDASGGVALCIGPEGGLGATDLAVLEVHGATLFHLGARVIRSRYAGAIAATLLLAGSGDLALEHPGAIDGDSR